MQTYPWDTPEFYLFFITHNSPWGYTFQKKELGKRSRVGAEWVWATFCASCAFSTHLSLIFNRSLPHDDILLVYRPNLITWQIREQLDHWYLRFLCHLLTHGQVYSFYRIWVGNQLTNQIKTVFSKSKNAFSPKSLMYILLFFEWGFLFFSFPFLPFFFLNLNP